MSRDIYKHREEYKPFEYPEVVPLYEALDKTYWVPTEITWDGTIQEFNTMLTPYKQGVFKRTTLAISQVEVAVKAFWGEIYNYLPKPEFSNLGASFSNNERAHTDTYSMSLEVLDLLGEFKEILKVPAFKKKYDLITKSMSKENKSFPERLLFFTLVIENSSLFSQFAIALSFCRFDGVMKDLSNMIGYTAHDEVIHSSAGIMILNLLKQEGHDIGTKNIAETVKEYIEIERDVLEWIFQGEDLVFTSPNGSIKARLTVELLLDYLKDRLDKALVKIGEEKVFNIHPDQISNMFWFEEEVNANALDDFFAKRPTEYTKNDKAFTGDDLF